MLGEYPIWSWSYSRHQQFEKCKRMYYYNYYAYWNGWKDDVSEETKTLYRLKKLQNIYAVMGNAFQSAINQAIFAKRDLIEIPSEQQLIQLIGQSLALVFEQSMNHAMWWKSPSKRTMLSEVYHDGKEAVPAAQIIQRVNQCMQHFFTCWTWERLGLASDWELIEVDDSTLPFKEPPIILGHPLYAKPDLLVHFKSSNEWLVVDWKTGKADVSHMTQVALYAMYVHEVYRVPIEQIRVRVEYLLDGSAETFDVNALELAEVRQFVLKSAEMMQQLLEDKQKNRALPLEAFEACSSSKTCASCVFRTVCSAVHPTAMKPKSTY